MTDSIVRRVGLIATGLVGMLSAMVAVMIGLHTGIDYLVLVGGLMFMATGVGVLYNAHQLQANTKPKAPPPVGRLAQLAHWRQSMLSRKDTPYSPLPYGIRLTKCLGCEGRGYLTGIPHRDGVQTIRCHMCHGGG